MNTVAQVFGAIVASFATVHVATKDPQSLEGTYRGFHLLGLLASSLTGYLGTIAAFDASWWAFLAGLGPVAIAALVLFVRHEYRHCALLKAAERYLTLSPLGTLTESTTFSEAVSIALQQYGLTDASRLTRFSFDTLQRAFATTSLRLGRWLSYAEFRAECTSSSALHGDYDFGAKAALLVFVDPTAAIQCRRWFVEYSVLLKPAYSLKGMELVDLIRFIWKSGVLDRGIQLDCTLRAFKCLESEPMMAKSLCVALLCEHPDDIWIHRQLFSKLAYLGRELKLESIVPHETLDIAQWYAPGSKKECQFCKYRPPASQPARMRFFRSALAQSIQFFRSPYCKICRVETLEKLKVEDGPPARLDEQLHEETPLSGIATQA
ncbi:hypothetical protein PSACC_01160 [Paramicrosporidium saccamoebae]|uniref:Uncharacterized protein n=1 Tax=Paramicrosporidium saccamoebae TaxID=1246581 RepID=A0A2H9TMT6_9FUNG|nr:hypothetical protein PSACC_01160 [Paramicrosporidium saccamoebae]